jgi:hypothetical protein
MGTSFAVTLAGSCNVDVALGDKHIAVRHGICFDAWLHAKLEISLETEHV